MMVQRTTWTLAFHSYRETASRPGWWLLSGILVLMFGVLAASILNFVLPGSRIILDSPVPQLLMWNSVTFLTLPLVTNLYGNRFVRGDRQGTSALLHGFGVSAGNQIIGHFIASTLLVTPVLFFVFVIQFVLTKFEIVPPQIGNETGLASFSTLTSGWVINCFVPVLIYGAISILVGITSRSTVALQMLWVLLLVVGSVYEFDASGLSASSITIMTLLDPTLGFWFEHVLTEPNLGGAAYSDMSLVQAFSYQGHLLLWNRTLWLVLAIMSLIIGVRILSSRLRPKHSIPKASVAIALQQGTSSPDPHVPNAHVFTKTTSMAGRPRGRCRFFLVDSASLLRKTAFWVWQILAALTTFIYIGFVIPFAQTEYQTAISTNGLISDMGPFLWWLSIASVIAAAFSINRDEFSKEIDQIINRTSARTSWIVIGRFLACLAPGLLILASAMIGLLASAIWLSTTQSEQIDWAGMSPLPALTYYVVILLPGSMLVSATLLLGFAVCRSMIAPIVILVILGLPTILGLWGVVQPTWTTDWMLSGIRWSESAPFEYERIGIILNRALVSGLALAALGLAVRIWPRVAADPVATPSWTNRILRSMLRPLPLMGIIIAIISACWLEIEMAKGWESSTVERRVEFYNQHYPTWFGAPQPTLESIDFTCEILPDQRTARIQATLHARNLHDDKLRTVAFSVSPLFDISRCTSRIKYGRRLHCHTPYEDRMLYEVEANLDAGEVIVFETEYELTIPHGLGKRPGQYQQPFILPGGVLLSRFPGDFSFLPSIGFTLTQEGLSWRDVAGPVDRRFGMGGLDQVIDIEARVTVPDGYRVNMPGDLISLERTGDTGDATDVMRTYHWKTLTPVAPLFHLVAGRWDVLAGEHGEVWYDPMHREAAARSFEALEEAVPAFSSWFGKLDYDTIRLNEFPSYTDYSQSADQNIILNEFLFQLRRTEEYDLAFSTTAHEIAHLWWGVGLVPAEGRGGNIISEGLAEYSTIRLLQHARGDEARQSYLKAQENIYLNERDPSREPMMDRVLDDDRYSTVVNYNRAGWIFWMAASILGIEHHDAQLKDMAEYYHERTECPVLEDYIAWMSANAGENRRAFGTFARKWMSWNCVNEFVLTKLSCKSPSADESDWTTTLRVNLVSDESCSPPFEVTIAVMGEQIDGSPQELQYQIPEHSNWPIEIEIRSPFQPTQAVVDPDVNVLQINRDGAKIDLP